MLLMLWEAEFFCNKEKDVKRNVCKMPILKNNKYRKCLGMPKHCLLSFGYAQMSGRGLGCFHQIFHLRANAGVSEPYALKHF